MVGKWHLGSYKKEYTPIYRGFESHLGYWTGHQDYFDHTDVDPPGWGFDMRRNMELAFDLHGQYSTDVYAQEAVNIINNHNSSTPLFLYLAHAAVHSGNPYDPLQAPSDTIEKFSYIDNYKRQKFAAMMSKLDDSVGDVVNALAKKNMLENSIIVFSTDNGGVPVEFGDNAASNYPLRGVKATLWEGGLRGVGLLWSPLLKQSARVAKQFMHISDWLPTLLTAAGGNVSVTSVINSPTGVALKSINITLTPVNMLSLRHSAEINCSMQNKEEIACKPLEETCLFDIIQDPCEMRNVAKEFPKILEDMENLLAKYNNSAIPPGNMPLDPRGNPKFWNYVWTNFGDYI
ncbi:Sulfatase domain containing protein [Asbolus verrucosus]|uniref:Sulfatase domain containing protein n=1 Tax=Asbolus verrucosus TaxID=1661398 RepID=A0A482VKB1_ASBVE|nr:Sulfatase domain containing protein [Asbolus verrucosus]